MFLFPVAAAAFTSSAGISTSVSYPDAVHSLTTRFYLRLGETTGTTAYDETGVYHGTYVNTPTLEEPSLLVNDPNPSVGFNGINEKVTITDAAFLSYGDSASDLPFSISLIFIADTIGANYGGLLSKSDDITTTIEYGLYIDSSGYLCFCLYDASESQRIGIRTSAVISTGSTYHVVATYDGSSSASGLTLYLNGAEATTVDNSAGSYTAMHDTTSDVYIGSYCENDATYKRWFDGTIDEAALFSEEISSADAYTLYKSSAYFTPAHDYATNVAALSPVGYWRLGDTSSPASDEGGNYDGYFINSPTLGVTSLLSYDTDLAVYFNASTSEYVSVPDANAFSFGDSSSDSSFSITLVLKAVSLGSGKGALVSKASTGSSAEYALVLDNSGYLVFSLYDLNNSNYIEVSSQSALTAGNVYHVVATYDGTAVAGGMSLYVSGAAVGTSTYTTGSYTAMHNTTNSLRFGTSFNSETYARYFDGTIDEVAIFDYELSAAQVATLAQAAENEYVLSAVYPDLVAWYTFDSRDGTKLFDDHFNQNEAVLVAAPSFNYGVIDNGMIFGGTQYVRMPIGAEISALPISMSFWVKFDSTSGVIPLVSTSDWKDVDVSFSGAIVYLSGGNLVAGYGDDTGATIADCRLGTGDSTLTTATWYHIVAVIEGPGDISIYLDNVAEDITLSGSGGTMANSPFANGKLGLMSNTTDYTRLDGMMDQVRLFSGVLTPAQIYALYSEGGV